MRRISCMASINTGKYLIVGRVDVAIAATRTLVRNPECRMVENRSQPGSSHPGGMTGRASRRIRSDHVIGHVRAIILRVGEVRLVAAVAIRGWITSGIVATQMAVRASVDHRPDRTGDSRARGQHVWTLERETRRSMVKLSVGP